MGVQDTMDHARTTGSSLIAVLLDPDMCGAGVARERGARIAEAGADLILVGGSLMQRGDMDSCVRELKEGTELPVVIFPGHPLQFSAAADALLFLSLISGRNPDLLIGQHIHAAPILRQSGIEILPTGYILVDGHAPTSVSYMSQTQPIPRNKPGIAACTAMAGEMLGMRNIYLEAGSGADLPVPADMVAAIRQACSHSALFAGGGIRDANTAYELAKAGADVVVVGSILEKEFSLLEELVDAVHGN